ncbi:hypothetical protein [Angustibacter aerolatus]
MLDVPAATPEAPSRTRRVVLLLALAAVFATAAAFAVLGDRPLPPDDPARGLVYAGMSSDVVHCGTHRWRVDVAGSDLVGCGHLDTAPKGVDVRVKVPTSVLQARVGAGPQAVRAAQQAGVAGSVADAGDPAVPCDGDGASGYRVQAMYVVEAGVANRYADLKPSLQRWAAGVDDVFNRSAALTGGVRHLRYVTEPSGGTCVAKVLNVTVPAGSNVDFNHTIAAVQAQGYDDPSRKYLMWTDANRLCGIGLVYLSDTKAQSNSNNGAAPQWARIDNGCWGYGNGGTQHSVEAHELAHTLGSVMGGAPHATSAGHCYDESDTMCYADGGGKAMQQVCAPNLEYLLDCDNDDYYSTYPDPGSWLDTHWNVASSRFLLGGGDGAGGGTAGTPTKLGAIVQVNNPAVPGLATQAQVTPVLPPGRTLTSVTWKAANTACLLGSPSEVQTDVTCPVSLTKGTTLTATLVDSTGATKVVSSPLALTTTGALRPVTVEAHLAGQSGTDEGVCTGVPAPLLGQVTDTATEQPVLGLKVTFRRTTAAGAVSTSSAATGLTGVARGSLTTSAPVTAGASTAAVGRFAAGTATSAAVTAAACTPALAAESGADESYYGDPVTVSGTLTRTLGGDDVSIANAAVQVQEVVAGGRTVTLGTVRTGDDGSWSLAVRPTASGMLRATLPAGPGWPATYAVAGDLDVALPSTALSGAADTLSVGYGGAVVATGTMRRVAGTDERPVPGATVQLKVVPASGAPVLLGSGRTTLLGAWRVAAAPKVSGQLQAVYLGVSGQPAATEDLGELTVGTWQPAVTLTAVSGTRLAGTAVPVSGTVTRTYAGATTPAPGVKVQLLLVATTGAEVPLGTATTTTAGTWKGSVAPKEDGEVVARVAQVGYEATDSTGVAQQVTTRVTGSAARTARVGVAQPVSVTVSAPRALAVTLQQLVGGVWTDVAEGTTSDAGALKLALAGQTAGVRTYRVVTADDDRGAAGTSTSFTVTTS